MKYLLYLFMPSLLDMGFDFLIIAARKLAAKTETTIDDDFVNKLEEYKDQLLSVAKEGIGRK